MRDEEKTAYIPSSSSKKKSSLSSLNEFLSPKTPQVKQLTSNVSLSPSLTLGKMKSSSLYNQKALLFPTPKSLSSTAVLTKILLFSLLSSQNPPFLSFLQSSEKYLFQKKYIFLFLVYVLPFLCPPHDLCCSHLFFSLICAP